MRDLDKYQADYALHEFEQHQVRYRKRHTIECLRRYCPHQVLEVGCGLSPLFVDYAEFETMDVVEPSNVFFEFARVAAAGDQRIRLHAGTLEQHAQALSARPYDFILLSGLLHEVEFPDALLACVRELCSQDTVVHVNVPNAKSLHRLLALEMGLIETLDELSATQRRLQQHRTFDLTSLVSLICRAGFAVRQSGSFFVKPFTHSQMAHLQSTGLLTDQMLDGLYGLTAYLPEYGSEIFATFAVRPA